MSDELTLEGVFAAALQDAASRIYRHQAEWREHWLGLALVAAIAAKDEARPRAERDTWRLHRDAAKWLAQHPPEPQFVCDGVPL